MKEAISMSQAQNYIRLESMLQRSSQAEDPAYQAALYLLSTDTELTELACKYIDGDGIRFTGIKRATTGYDEKTRQLIDVAHNLFSYNSPCKVTPFDLSRLGYPKLEQVCSALYIAYGQVAVQILDRDKAHPQLKLDDSHYRRAIQIQQQFEQMTAAATEQNAGEMEI